MNGRTRPEGCTRTPRMALKELLAFSAAVHALGHIETAATEAGCQQAIAFGKEVAGQISQRNDEESRGPFNMRQRGAPGANPFRLIIPDSMYTDTTPADETRAARVLRSLQCEKRPDLDQYPAPHPFRRGFCSPR